MTPECVLIGAVCHATIFDFDFIVIGSGFGGSVSAHRLTEKGYRVAVIEMGRRWTPETLPQPVGRSIAGSGVPNLACAASSTCVFSGTRPSSMVARWAVDPSPMRSTLLSPPEKVWEKGSWSGLADWKAEMPAHYADCLADVGRRRKTRS